MDKSILVNGKNYFNEDSLNEMIKQLENGNSIRIYIDCIGHARNQYETSIYVEALTDKFGERFITDSESDFMTIYKLA